MKTPLVAFFINGTVHMYRDIIKARNFVGSEARKNVLRGVFVTLRIAYTEGIENSGTYKTWGDLDWAWIAFTDRFLWFES